MQLGSMYGIFTHVYHQKSIKCIDKHLLLTPGIEPEIYIHLYPTVPGPIAVPVGGWAEQLVKMGRG